ncbi:hypothetical protein ACH2FV_19765 (plasmid) [Bacillus safensis subsp. safensis]|uniref:hypothetical protein n=1 Tax=Bacillus safensis TaxID=561879 RepID=UPI0037C12CCF
MKRVWQLPPTKSKKADYNWIHPKSKYHAYTNKHNRSMCGKHEQSDDFFETGLAEKHIIKSPHIACKKCLELASKYYCNNCGNSRYFYNEMSVMAIKFIDNKQGAKDGKIMDVDPTNFDNYFEPVYCYNCAEMVAESMERKN